MKITLAIKKIYYDQIKNGVKKTEYRQFSDYYKKLFDKNPKEIMFHYQTKEKMHVKIKKIDIIDNFIPVKDRPVFLKTNKIYAIELDL